MTRRVNRKPLWCFRHSWGAKQKSRFCSSLLTKRLRDSEDLALLICFLEGIGLPRREETLRTGRLITFKRF